MQNVTTSIKDGTLTIKVDLNKRFGKSASGKTTIIATTSGNQVIDSDSGAVMGLNIYTKKEQVRPATG